ncbi:hypothetical protein OsJ_14052 [Oryza sativa Japonica Group]|uniref:Uncharacterized protein n=1 Tax=Oryza sativa subsp. japonica TaxID=39947 RepID=B9FE42_ORYSJ|nr:hypothetical protein OsJ_14052 [Oryza sativa Japonica Group]
MPTDVDVDDDDKADIADVAHINKDNEYLYEFVYPRMKICLKDFDNDDKDLKGEADEPSVKNTEDKTLPDELQGREPG